MVFDFDDDKDRGGDAQQQTKGKCVKTGRQGATSCMFLEWRPRVSGASKGTHGDANPRVGDKNKEVRGAKITFQFQGKK